MDDWDLYARHAWGWRWLDGAWCHPNVRVSDCDGKVHRNGRMLLLEGKETLRLPEVSTADRIAVEEMRNVTFLYMRGELDRVSHEPLTVSHFYLDPGPFPARAFMIPTKAWVATTKQQVAFMCAAWAAWTCLDLAAA